MDLKNVFKTWLKTLPPMVIVSGLLILVGYLISRTGVNLATTPGLFLLLGFGGIAFGFEKHELSWKKWVVLVSGAALAVFAGSLVKFDLIGLLTSWILALIGVSGLMSIDLEQTVIDHLCPDFWTEIFSLSSFVALIPMLSMHFIK